MSTSHLIEQKPALPAEPSPNQSSPAFEPDERDADPHTVTPKGVM
jgi:hypothetical protein